ncbi:peptidase P60 [Rhodoplanes elegans]|uniref:Peptidase P60 n=1 Tax=Rhodoplanes elegans TaxID=29408 RepID=A0A327KI47_9BRAD|nr:NlpC/P60 family protein [Rhodoplanes elegans]MBK5959416.1 peptidase P60 [Rhodoplanes elegans]RAI37826.1 peptidase P60 [Rhodoplanes elegans]
MTLDPRLTPARPDLAASHLRGQVEAERFVDGVPRVVVAAQAPLRRRREPDAPLDTEALFGEVVTVYEADDEGWSWAQLDDGYVGYLPSEALAAPGPAPTHRVAALRTFVFPAASIKTPPVTTLSLGARVAVARTEGVFAVLATGGFVFSAHLASIDTVEPDFVAVAETFVGTPYLWGGKSSLGLDCSGLVQVALAAAGIAAPRDSDMQERGLGTALPAPHDLASWRRGDLVFWTGHVAIVRDAATILHANAHHMAVAIEPAAAAVARIAAAGGAITSVRRLADPPPPV